MIRIAIDTAADRGSVSLGRGAEVWGSRILDNREHASLLAPSIAELLAQAGIGHRDVDEVVVGDGPGSFTGLRIGFATAFGMRKARARLRILSVPSLAGVASVSGLTNGIVVAVYDALRSEVFAAAYRPEGGALRQLMAPARLTIGKMRSLFPDVAAVIGHVGDRDGEEIAEWTGRPVIGPVDRPPVSEGLMQLVYSGFAAHRIGTSDEFMPEYGRLAEAQVRWEAKNQKNLPYSSGRIL